MIKKIISCLLVFATVVCLFDIQEQEIQAKDIVYQHYDPVLQELYEVVERIRKLKYENNNEGSKITGYYALYKEFPDIKELILTDPDKYYSEAAGYIMMNLYKDSKEYTGLGKGKETAQLIEELRIEMGITDEYWGYILDGFLIKGNELKAYFGYGGSIIIPEVVTSISNFAFSDGDNFQFKITGVKLPSKLKHIGKGSFQHLQIEEINFPDSLETIDEIAFKGTLLKEIVLKKGITYGSSVFTRSDNCENVIIEDGVTIIPKFAFRYSKKVTSITIPSSVKDIEWNAFEGLESLRELNLPDEGELSIGESAFRDCKKLAHLHITSGVKRVYAFAFNGVPLQSVRIDEGVKEFGSNVLYGGKFETLKLPNSISFLAVDGDLTTESFTGVTTFACEEGSYAYEYALNNDLNIMDPDTYVYPIEDLFEGQPSSWAINNIEDLARTTIFESSRYKNFQGEVNRLDFIYFLTRAYEIINLTEIEVSDSYQPFTDTSDLWARKAYKLGLTNGIGNGLFDPYGTLTREQASVFFNKITYSNTTASYELLFADDDKIASWSRDAVYRMRKMNILNGVSETEFSPQSACSTEMALVILYRVVSRSINI